MLFFRHPMWDLLACRKDGDDTGDGEGGGSDGSGASDDGAGTGGGDGAGDDSGGSDGDDFASRFDAFLVEDKKWKRKVNNELGSRRHRARDEGSDNARGGDSTDDSNKGVTREELKSERTFSRIMGRLEADGISDEDLEYIEDETSEMDFGARASFVSAYAKGREAVAKGKGDDDPEDDDTRRSGRTRGNRRRRAGGEPPPRPKGADHPETFEEYLAIAKKDKPRKARLDADPTFDPVELRRQGRDKRLRAFIAAK